MECNTEKISVYVYRRCATAASSAAAAVEIVFGRDDFVAALALLVIFVVVLPGLAWSLLSNRRMEFLP